MTKKDAAEAISTAKKEAAEVLATAKKEAAEVLAIAKKEDMKNLTNIIGKLSDTVDALKIVVVKLDTKSVNYVEKAEYVKNHGDLITLLYRELAKADKSTTQKINEIEISVAKIVAISGGTGAGLSLLIIGGNYLLSGLI